MRSSRLKWWLAFSFAIGSSWAVEDCRTLVEAGRKSFEDRRFEEAIKDFQKALPLCSERLPVLVWLGQVQYLVGKEQDAENSFTAALTIDANHVPALYALGRLYYQQHRYPEAVERFKKVVAIEPRHHRAHDNLGLCYDALQRDSDALRHFFKALDLVMKDNPDYDWAHANLADFFLKRNQFEKAFQLAAEAASRNPQSARNAFLTGKALVKLEKHDLSLRWLEQATKLDPDYSEGWYLLAQSYRKLDRPEDGEKALARFKEANAKPRPRR